MTTDDLRLLKYGLFWAVIVGAYFGGASWLQGHFKSPWIFWIAAVISIGVLSAAFRREAENISGLRLLGHVLRVAAWFGLYIGASYWVQKYSQSRLAGVGVLVAWLGFVWIVEHYAQRKSKQLKN